MSKFKKGDMVLIVSKGPNSFDWHPKMDAFIGSGVAYPVVGVQGQEGSEIYHVEINDGHYLFYASSIALDEKASRPVGKYRYLDFDLDDAQAGAKLVTRSGRDAKFIAFEPRAIFPLVVMLAPNNEIFLYRKDGTNFESDPDMTIVIAEPIAVRYVNLFQVRDRVEHGEGEHYATEAEALEDSKAWVAKGGTPMIAVAVPVEVREQ